MKRLFSLFLMSTLVYVATIAANVREVIVTYNDSTAIVEVSPDLKALVTASVNGADVQVSQSADALEKITYRLKGASDNGSFLHNGDSPITLSLEGLKLTSQTGAAVQIKDNQRIAVLIKENTENVLTDMEGGSQKACMVVKGAVEFWGTGSLTINGRGKHALKCDGCVELKAAMGTITMTSSVKDGIHTDESVLVSGGTIDITTTGSGYWDTDDLKTKAPACINSAASVIVSGGKLNLSSTGDGGKAIKCDSVFTMTDGLITARATGQRYIYEGYEGDRADVDNIPDSLKTSPKAIKADCGISIAGGILNLYTLHDGGEGLESKDTLTISGGKLTINAYDDCINAAGDIRISGGDLYLNSSDNDGIDTNQSMYISGGNIITLGSYLHELGIDVNDKSPNKQLNITGGNIVCIGGNSQIAHPVACEGVQPVVYCVGNFNAGTSLLLRCVTDGTDVIRYQLERDYTQEAGGTAPELCLMLTAPALQEGYSYQLIDENTSTVLASVASLSIPYSDMQADDSRFSKDTFSFGQFSLPYRQADICLEQSAAPIVVLYLHGGTSRGSDNESQLKEAAVSVIYDYLEARNIPATFIVPQCPAGGGWTSQLRKVVNELVKQNAEDGIHDANRIYVMGGSMGGTGTWAQLSYFPDFYAAAMPVAGNPTGLDAANVATTPVRTVMGTNDNIMSITPVEEFQESVLAAGGTVILETEEGWTHQNTCEQSYTDERLDWLFGHVKGVVDGVDSIVQDKDTSDAVYDLCGRRIAKPAHGVYIQGGKKYIR